MARSSRLKKLVSLLFLLILAGAVIWGQSLLNATRQFATHLQAKDPVGFALMVEDAKEYRIQKAVEGLVKLQAMNEWEAAKVRYVRLLKQLEKDKEFRQASISNGFDERAALQKARKDSYEKQMQELERPPIFTDKESLAAQWKKSGPWQRGMILREKCLEFMSLRDRELKLKVLSERSGKLFESGSRKISPATVRLCNDLVPLSHESKTVARGLENMKREMNYFRFTRLLDEIGVQSVDMYTYPEKLQTMTGAFTDA